MNYIISIVFIALQISFISADDFITDYVTWDEDVTIGGNLTIQQDATLVIMPGVTVTIIKVDSDNNDVGEVKINVEGRLIVQGEVENPVIFQGVDPNNSDYAEWGGISFQGDSNADASTITNAIIRNANIPIDFESNTLTMTNVDIHTSYSHGIFVDQVHTLLSLNNVNVYDAGDHGMHIDYEASSEDAGEVILNNTSFINCGWVHNGDGIHLGDGQLSYSGGTVYNSADNGMQVGSGFDRIYTEDVIFSTSDENGLHINTDWNFRDFEFRRCQFISNDYDGFHSCRSREVDFYDCEFSSNNRDGIHSSCDGNSYIIGHFYNSTASDNQSNGIETNGGLTRFFDGEIKNNRDVGVFHRRYNWHHVQRSNIYGNDWEECDSCTKYQYKIHCDAAAEVYDNYWGQIDNLDQIIVCECNSGDIKYDGAEPSLMSDKGANFQNLPPSFTMLTPSDLFLDETSGVTVSWTDMDLDDNATIELYYTEDILEQGILFATRSEDDRDNDEFWNVSNVPNGIYYIYGVLDDGNYDPVVSFAPERVMVGSLTASIPDDLSAPQGEQIVVPINLQNVIPEYNLLSFQFVLNFDLFSLEFDSIDVSGTIAESWNVTINSNLSSQVIINGFSTEALQEPGTLVNLIFNVSNSIENLEFSTLDFAEFDFNEGNPDVLIDNGVFTCLNNYTVSGTASYFGNNTPLEGATINLNDSQVQVDADGNFTFGKVPSGDYSMSASYESAELGTMVISPYDASIIAQYAVLSEALDDNQLVACDASGNGDCQVFDAALIAQYSVGFDVSDYFVGQWNITPGSYDFNLSQDETTFSFGGVLRGDVSGNWPGTSTRQTDYLSIDAEKGDAINVLVSTSTDFSSLWMDINYDRNNMELISVNEADVISDFTSFTNPSDGRIRYGSFSPSSTSSEESVVSLLFVALENLNGATVSADVMVNEDYEINTLSYIIDSTLNNNPNEIYDFTLNKIYPNPFNPSTTIDFEMKYISDHQIAVYNLNGQLVSLVSSGILEAGKHSVIWDASGLSAGQYFVTFKVGKDIVSSHKISLIK